MRKLILIIYFILFSLLNGIAQNLPALLNGRINYQKRVNLYALLDDLKGLSNDEKLKLNKIKESTGQFFIQDFTLSFQKDKYYFKRNEAGIQNALTAISNLTIFTDLSTKIFYSEKSIGNDNFFISDTIIPIIWRITDETRNIQGVECRRANGLLFDSIYVVAFFASNIPISGGPDIISGLPGMVLEAAIPQFHTTWLATRISVEELKDEREFNSSFKNSKYVNYKSFLDSIKNMSKNWGFLKELFFQEIRI